MTDPTPQAPSQKLTDEQLLELMPEQFRADLATASRLAAKDAGPDTKPGVFRVILNTGAVAYARAAIAAHEAQRMEWLKGSREIAILTAAIDGRIAATVEAAPAPAPTPEEVEARFLAWWAESYPHAPVGSHAVASHVAFALHLLGGEVQ